MSKDKKMTPVLYILMRTDLDSLNPGKAIAQGSHATSLFENEMQGNQDDHMNLLSLKWDSDCIGFGTTIVLGVPNERELKSRISEASDRSKVISDIVLDPTYPIKDGQAIHCLPLVTCGYIFGDKSDVEPFIKGLSLY